MPEECDERCPARLATEVQGQGGGQSPPERRLMVEIGYLRMEEVPGIPRWPSQPAAIVYARLGDMPVAPDVVIVAARAGMTLGRVRQKWLFS